MHETGVLDKLEYEHFDLMNNNSCLRNHHVAQSVLGIEDIWSLFVVLGAGLTLSSIVLYIEYLTGKYFPRMFNTGIDNAPDEE